MIDKLRDEIIESQKARTDLMKWKLILVAAIGAAGFGIGSNVPQGATPRSFCSRSSRSSVCTSMRSAFTTRSGS